MNYNTAVKELNNYTDEVLWRICYLGYDFVQGENWPRTFKQYQEMTITEFPDSDCETLHQYLVELAWQYLYEEI